MVAVLLAGMLILTAFGQALGGKVAAQRAADLSAMSAARSMQRDYPRLFLPPVLPERGAEPAPHAATGLPRRARGVRPRPARAETERAWASAT